MARVLFPLGQGDGDRETGNEGERGGTRGNEVRMLRSRRQTRVDAVELFLTQTFLIPHQLSTITSLIAHVSSTSGPADSPFMCYFDPSR